jgi:DNA-binding NtrC family response regulator
VKNNKGKILLVEDDKNQRGIIKSILTKEGFFVEDAGTGRAGIDLLRLSPFDVVLTDLRLPDMEGTEILKEVRAQNRPCHVIIITAYGSIPSAIEATKLGAFYYLEKPLEKDQLLLVLQNALNQVMLLKDNLMLKDQLQGDSTGPDRRASRQDGRAFQNRQEGGSTNSTVLILGESRTGRALCEEHTLRQPRKNRPFFAINCASIPESLSRANSSDMGLHGSHDTSHRAH